MYVTYYSFCLLPSSLLTESVYDLLPKELQSPSSTEQNPKVMSQKSGGEAGPPPSASLASGMILSLFVFWSCPAPKTSHGAVYLYLHTAGEPVRQPDSCSVILTLEKTNARTGSYVITVRSSEHACCLYLLVLCEIFSLSGCCDLLWAVVSCSNRILKCGWCTAGSDIH